MKELNGRFSSSLILRSVRSILFLVMGLYLFYFFVVALFLNTPLFTKVTGMSDPELTQITFQNAWSIYPGRLYSGSVVVAIRDPNVSSRILLENANILFDFGKLFKREVNIQSLHVRKTDVFFHMKTPDEKQNHRAKYSKPEDAIKPSEIEEAQMQNEGWKIIIAGIDLAQVDAIRFDDQKLSGQISVAGEFKLHPKVSAEVGPAVLRIRDGKWNEDLTSIQAEAKVRFLPWSVIRTSGPGIYENLDAEIQGTATAESLKILDVTLRSLGEYGFGAGAAKMKAKVAIQKGRLLPGSMLAAAESSINFKSPRLNIEGKGEIGWSVPEHGDFSQLTLKASEAKANVQLSKRMAITGVVPKVEAEARLDGLFIPDAFSGIQVTLKIQESKLEATTKSEEPWKIHARIGGEVRAIAGNVKDARKKGLRSRLQLDIVDSQVKLKQFGKIQGAGTLILFLDPIDFRDGKAVVPEAVLDYHAKIQDQYAFQLRMTNRDLERVFGSSRKSADHWDGKTRLEIGGFDEILRFLADNDQIPGLVKSVLTAKTMKTALEWQFAPESLWMRANSIKSEGAWSAWGTYVAGNGEVPLGVFEAKVVGIPVGVGLVDDELKVKVLPGKKWYDELKTLAKKKPAPPAVPLQPVTH